MSKPVKLASYDTSASTSGNNGAWGCYPFQDSGVIYISDRDNGLFLLQVDCGHMNRFGGGSAPKGSAIPQAHWEGASPRVGASKLELRIERLQAGAKYALAITSKSVPSFKLLGVDVHVDIANAVWVLGTADGQGRAVVPAPVPGSPGLAGARVYMQVFATDGKAANGFSASRGMWSGLCK